MKNLKIKFGLFSLLAVLAVSIFLTSCEQAEIVDTLEEQTSDIQDRSRLLMPYGFENLSEEEKIEYFGNLTEEDYGRLSENHRVGSYLRSIDKYWGLYESMEEGQLVLDMDLSGVLTAEEVTALSNYQYDNIELRGCGSWSFAYSYFTHHPYYQTRCVYKRSCQQLVFNPWPSYTFWTEYVSNTSCISPDTV